MSTPWMLYGASGYTGRLIAQAAVARGMQPVLAGRDPHKIEPLARSLGCPWRAFPLSAADHAAQQLSGMAAVLHCAGPFATTAAPMLEACLAAGVHYLDITGEIDVIELAHSLHVRATAAGTVVLPAVGMDVVPSDCLAAQLAAALPDARTLQLAFAADWTMSHGTAKTILRQAAAGGRVRQEGRIVRVPALWKTLDVPLPSGPRCAVTIPWGDVASAFYTTGIGTIEVYAALPRHQLRLLRWTRWLAPALGLAPVQSLGRWWISRQVRGPTEHERATGRTEFWGRTLAPDGRVAEATLETPNGYALTVETALAVLQAVLAGTVTPGFSTPASALGSDFACRVPGVVFRWLARP